MKKTIAICLLCACLLMSCEDGGKNGEKGTTTVENDTRATESVTLEVPSEEGSESATEEPTEATDTTESSGEDQTETSAPTDDAAEDDAYLALPVRAVEKYEKRFFTFPDSGILMHLELPADWEIAPSEDGYRILRAGIEIGTLRYGGKQGSSDWKLLDTDVAQKGDVLAERYLEKSGIGETLAFRRRYYFRYQEGFTRRIVTMTVDYSELDEAAAMHLLSKRGAISKSLLDPGLGTLTEAQWGSVAIMGNSFISSSRIGGILNDMHVQNGKACYIDAMARGYAHIDTYVNDTALMNEVRAGAYDVVFICGVNSLSYLEELKEICDAGQTTLVIFPAHNEPQGQIDSARAAYPDIRIMDWKGEIDALINDGRDFWDFCIDDDHKHSSPLGGYVGAHMIYRAIWGEVPTGESGYGVTQEEIDKILGEYVSTGRVLSVDEADVILLE